MNQARMRGSNFPTVANDFLEAALATPETPTRSISPFPSRRSRRRAIGASAGRQLNLSAAILALSVFADSSVEHYRGSFRNRAMYTPLATAALTLGASLFGIFYERPKRHPARDGIYILAAVTGLVGLGFHTYNVAKRPGRVSWQNLFYGAPIGAPVALLLSGLLGRGAEKVRDAEVGEADVLGLPAGRMLAAVSAVGLAGTVSEAGLLHLRGAFQNPAMVLPVSLPPIAAALLAAEAAQPNQNLSIFTRFWLTLTAALGFAGVGFHIFGVSRGMGGWRNWRQNVLNGPPIPAPPSFTGLALAGLAAVSLLTEDLDD